MNCSSQAFLSITNSWGSLRLTSIDGATGSHKVDPLLAVVELTSNGGNRQQMACNQCLVNDFKGRHGDDIPVVWRPPI